MPNFGLNCESFVTYYIFDQIDRTIYDMKATRLRDHFLSLWMVYNYINTCIHLHI